MRNKAIIVLLNEWAEWVDRCRITGAPSRIRSWWGPMVTDPHMGAGRGPGRRLHEPVNEARAQRTDVAVKALPRRPRICIWQQYIRGGTKKQKAKAYGTEERTFYDHLELAERQLEIILEEQEKHQKPTCMAAPESEILAMVQ